MIRTRQLFTAALAATLLVATTGCIKAHHTVTVMPDGSGKMTFLIGANVALLQQLGAQPGQDPASQFSLEEANENMNGFVAFARPKKTEAAGWKYTEITGYFEDISKVTLGDEGDRSSFTWTKEGDTFKLTMQKPLGSDVTKDLGEQLPPADDPNAAAQRAQMQMAFKGFEIKEIYNLPANVTGADGLTAEGRTATLTVTDEAMLDPAKRPAPTQKMTRELTATGNAIPAAEVDAFKAEMAAAVKEWEAIKKEMQQKDAAEDATEEAVEDAADN